VASVLVAAGVGWTQQESSSSTKLDGVDVFGVPPPEPTITTRIQRAASKARKETTDVINWSGTHRISIDNDKLWEPETVEEVEAFVKECHRRGQAIRPIGSSLSPNGIALNSEGMIQMANIDRVLEIDTENQTITVEAGITVQRVVEALRPYGLTLPNLASIAEQQMGGFTQVGAHGTGKAIAPVDHYVTRLKLVTPGLGTIVLTKEQDGTLFELAKVAVGCLGVVVEVTMQCIPAHNLLEHTFVLTRQEAKEQLDDLLKNHKHMRYMWIPYTDTVVCVTNDPEHLVKKSIPRNRSSKASPEEKMRPLVDLFDQLCKEYKTSFSKEDVIGLGFGELRDALLAFAPLDIEHVKRCNKAEAEFWSMSEGYQTKPSDQLLQFDCGGQVSEDVIQR
jgi:L-galactono-1,4-lactone dehydrogenase